MVYAQNSKMILGCGSEVDLNGSLWYTVAFNFMVIIELKAVGFSQIRILGGIKLPKEDKFGEGFR